MKLNNSLLFIFLWFPLIPQLGAQGTKETINQEKAKIAADTMAFKIDSLKTANDSLSSIMTATVDKLESEANALPEKVKQLQRDVQRLADRKPDTVERQTTKYIPVPAKEDYWRRQREYSDSLHNAEQDSIKEAWQNRSFFRKTLGLKPRKQRK